MENTNRKYDYFVENVLNGSLGAFPYLDAAVEWTVEEAVRRGQYETAVKLELACSRTAMATYQAQEFESKFDVDAKVRVVLAFYAAGETETARRLQHRWMITRQLPPEYRP